MFINPVAADHILCSRTLWQAITFCVYKPCGRLSHSMFINHVAADHILCSRTLWQAITFYL